MYIYIYLLVYQTLGDNGGSKTHLIRDPFLWLIIPSLKGGSPPSISHKYRQFGKGITQVGGLT